MTSSLRAKVREISQEALRRMEADASIAMLELSANFRKHVNRNLRDMAILMATPRPEDADWRRRLHELSRDLQGVGGSFDYGLLITIAEVMSRTIKSEALPSERKLQRRLRGQIDRFALQRHAIRASARHRNLRLDQFHDRSSGPSDFAQGIVRVGE